MAIFSKVDKKVLIISVILLIAFLLVGFILYRYITNSGVNVQNLTGGAQTEIKAK